MQNWIKLPSNFQINNHTHWAISHAMMPCVYKQDDDNFLVFFSPRDKLNQSRPASILLNMKGIPTFSEFSKVPLLELGNLGAFDDSGIMPTCVIKNEKDIYMYYNGWTLGKKIPFWSFNSVAISNDDGKSFTKLSRSPLVLFRTDIDPYSTFAPFVIKEDDKWMMWYVSCTEWIIENGEPKHYYHIKYAHSKDGINWVREGKVCIDFKSSHEYAIARPMVIKEQGLYKMWYSYRATDKVSTYRIGYAESENGIDWVRKDEEINLETSKQGWDSDMICYSFIFDYQDNRYMLYNGNGYGKTGFGLAMLEKK